MILIVCFAVLLYLTFKFVSGVFVKGKHVPDGYEEDWFGKMPKPLLNETAEDTSIRPFKIHVPDEVLTDLNNRLGRTRLEEPLLDSKFDYGFNTNYLRTVIEYWKTEYNWRKQEEYLNKQSHFKTCIEGIDVHFVHVKPIIPEPRQLKVIPLLIVHGWPGTFFEFHKIIHFLTTSTPERDFVFELIIPSIPGYGFSEAPHCKGFHARVAARIFHTLMKRLGHSKFYVQGGDWGSLIVSLVAKYYPSEVIGVHLNMFASLPKSKFPIKAILMAYFPFLGSSAGYKGFYPFKAKLMRMLQESGYMHLNGTKPDTIGCGMSDSPAGMAAYILEKFSTWTNHDHIQLQDGGLTKKYTIDELLTNVMIYWVNNNFTSAARFYKENFGFKQQEHEEVPITVPCGMAFFPNELLMIPKSLVLKKHVEELVSYTVMPRGGHFAAMEEPQLLADDIWNFVTLVEKKRV